MEAYNFHELTLMDKEKVAFTIRQIPPLKSMDIMVKSLFSSIKHGTEMLNYNGDSPFLNKEFNHKLRLLVPTRSEFYPRTIGNITVGEVVETGANVDFFKAGDLVYGWMPIRDYHVVDSNSAQHLNGLTPRQAICIDPAFFSAGLVRDARVTVGDCVAVFGIGAIGLFTIQFLKNAGVTVIAASAFCNRRRLARSFGADEVLDSVACGDLGLNIKELTNGGVDVAIECSGYYSRLQNAIRVTRQCGRVVTTGFYAGGAEELRLGEEFHLNQLEIISSQPGYTWDNPHRDYPLWNRTRHGYMVADAFRNRLISEKGILDPTIPFGLADSAMRRIATFPSEVVKVLIDHR